MIPLQCLILTYTTSRHGVLIIYTSLAPHNTDERHVRWVPTHTTYDKISGLPLSHLQSQPQLAPPHGTQGIPPTSEYI